MSKLVEKLRRVQTTEVRRMGFGAAANAKNASMVVIAAVLGGDAAQAFAAGADFVLVPAGNDPAGAVKAAAEDKAVGLDWPKANAAGVKDSGADFVVFDLDQASASIVRAEDVARVVVVDPSIEDSSLRALDALNLDAAIVQADLGDLTVRDLLRYRRISAFLRMPVLIQVSRVPAGETLATLRDSGIDGVVLEGGEVAALRKTVDDLPPRAKRKQGLSNVVVPRVGQAGGDDDEDDDEGE